MVLAHLVREENRECILAQDGRGRQLRAENLLNLVSQQNAPVRVVFDVGAQILELTSTSRKSGLP